MKTQHSGAQKFALTHPDTGAHWQTFAAQWALFSSPGRPCAEDVSLFEEMLAAETDLFIATAKRRAWLLGVTSEIVTAPWLQGIDLLAAERVRAMIDSMWPGNTESRLAICADWTQAPFADESFDLVIGDGCLMVVGFPDELARLLASVHRILHRQGYLLLRLFCRPDVTETPDAVIAELLSGAIGSIQAFKWRLGMAVQGLADAPDVAVADVWHIWNAAQIDPRALAQARGWSPEQVGTMELYRGSTARYNFMRFDETIQHLLQAGFDLVATRTGHYELAERCPCVLLRKRPSSSGAGAC
jgi:SAM-dependent methyltransferase